MTWYAASSSRVGKVRSSPFPSVPSLPTGTPSYAATSRGVPWMPSAPVREISRTSTSTRLPNTDRSRPLASSVTSASVPP
jgi:hypothetical protein